MAAGNQHAVRAAKECLQHKKRINTASTGNPDNPQVCRLGCPRNACRIRAAI